MASPCFSSTRPGPGGNEYSSYRFSEFIAVSWHTCLVAGPISHVCLGCGSSCAASFIHETKRQMQGGLSKLPKLGVLAVELEMIARDYPPCRRPFGRTFGSSFSLLRGPGQGVFWSNFSRWIFVFACADLYLEYKIGAGLAARCGRGAKLPVGFTQCPISVLVCGSVWDVLAVASNPRGQRWQRPALMHDGSRRVTFCGRI